MRRSNRKIIAYRPRHRYPKYKFNRAGEWTHTARERFISIAWTFIATGIGVIIGFTLAIYHYDLSYPWDILTPPQRPPVQVPWTPTMTPTITPIPPAPTSWHRLPPE